MEPFFDGYNHKNLNPPERLKQLHNFKCLHQDCHQTKTFHITLQVERTHTMHVP